MPYLENPEDISLEQKSKEQDKINFVRAALEQPDSIQDSKAEFLIRFGGGEIKEFDEIIQRLKFESKPEKQA